MPSTAKLFLHSGWAPTVHVLLQGHHPTATPGSNACGVALSASQGKANSGDFRLPARKLCQWRDFRGPLRSASEVQPSAGLRSDPPVPVSSAEEGLEQNPANQEQHPSVEGDGLGPGEPESQQGDGTQKTTIAGVGIINRRWAGNFNRHSETRTGKTNRHSVSMTGKAGRHSGRSGKANGKPAGRTFSSNVAWAVNDSFNIDQCITHIKELQSKDRARALQAALGACTTLLETRRVADCVTLLKAVCNDQLSARGLVEPRRMVAECVQMCSIDTVVRYLNLLIPSISGTYNHAMAEFAQRRNMDGVRAVWAAMHDCLSLDTYAYRAFFDACAKCGEAEEAMAAYHEMQQRRVKPNIIVLNSLMNSQAASHPDRVWELYQVVKARGLEPDAVTGSIVLKTCGHNIQPEQAWALYERMKGRMAVNAYTYTTLIQVFARARDVESAFRIASSMQAAGINFTAFTWCALMGACTRAGQVERAFTVFDEMVEAGVSPTTPCYNLLINACAWSGQEARALRLLDEMKAGGRGKHGSSSKCQPNLWTYNSLLNLYVNSPPAAERLVDTIRAAGLEPDLVTWTTLADAYAEANDVPGALGTFANMRAAGVVADVQAYTAVIKACMKGGEVDAAFGLFEQMKREGIRGTALTYNTLLYVRRAWAATYNIQRAIALYEEMRAAGYAPNDTGFRELMDAWADLQLRTRTERGRDASTTGLAQTVPPTTSTATSINNTTSPSTTTSSSSSSSPIAGNGAGGDQPVPPSQQQSAGGGAAAEGLPYFLDLVRGDEVEDPVSDPLLVDLHHLTKAEARAAVLSLLRTLRLRYFQGVAPRSGLTMITGRGLNSEVAGQGVVRAAVLHLLETELGIKVHVPSLDGGRRKKKEAARLDPDISVVLERGLEGGIGAGVDERDTDGPRGRQRDAQVDRERDRQADREANRQADTVGQADRPTLSDGVGAEIRMKGGLSGEAPGEGLSAIRGPSIDCSTDEEDEGGLGLRSSETNDEVDELYEGEEAGEFEDALAFRHGTGSGDRPSNQITPHLIGQITPHPINQITPHPLRQIMPEGASFGRPAPTGTGYDVGDGVVSSSSEAEEDERDSEAEESEGDSVNRAGVLRQAGRDQMQGGPRLNDGRLVVSRKALLAWLSKKPRHGGWQKARRLNGSESQYTIKRKEQT